MKTLWSATAFIAVVNLLAILGGIGFLAATDRLDGDRVREVRAVLAPTRAEAAAAKAEAEAAAAAEEAAELAAERRANPPLSPEATLAERTRDGASDRRLVNLVRQESRERREELLALRAEIDRERQDFEAEKAAWEARRADDADALADAQFQKTVRLFGAMKPKDVRARIVAMDGRGERDVAVRILDALAIRQAAKVLAEFKSEEEARLASDLLTGLRELGRDPSDLVGPTETSDDVDPLDEPGG